MVRGVCTWKTLWPGRAAANALGESYMVSVPVVPPFIVPPRRRRPPSREYVIHLDAMGSTQNEMILGGAMGYGYFANTQE